ncbi:MAG TPA: chromosome segregation protein SMC [Phycisphaerales bacterium]|nr:chromosome segregation protein SMC [Phycisphaerales bacterium]
MRLAKLTVCGFKSFADKTEFTFDHAITGIVGPNGCGKSNVVDAIKWVLGERSSKSLRGTEMIDVIFAGSAGRKPGGMASVALTFENPVLEVVQEEKRPTAELAESAEGAEERQVGKEGEQDVSISDASADPESASPSDSDPSSPTPRNSAPSANSAVVPLVSRRKRGLNFDADTVEIERRLYRDGDSEYLINGKTARLKDIREMFLDTGVGADAYSIIEQGKVDAMLLASPQERRVIFEEAAGIAKYKQRRVEAQRKLERTQANLTTTREQLESTERRLRLVRGQAVKARKFVELDSQLKAWRLALAFDQYDDLVQRLAGLTSRQADLSVQRDEGGATLAELETRKQEADLQRHELASQHKGVEQERLGAEHAVQQATQRQGMLERAVEEAQRQGQVDRQRQADIAQRLTSTETSITDQRESIAAMGESLAEAERRLQQAGSQRAEVLESLNERRQQLSQKQSSASRIDRERIGLLASIAADAKRIDGPGGLKEQIERLAGKAGKLTEDEGRLAEGITAGEATTKAAAEKVKELEWELTRLEEQLGRLSTDRRERADRTKSLEQELVRIDSRRATLQEMVENRAGFAESVRAVLKAREKGDGAFAGVIAPLADLIETRSDLDAEAAAAVESALGADLQALVIENAAALPSREDLAKLPGRVTFLPMTAAAPSPHTVPSVDLAAAGFMLDSARARLVSLRSLVKVRGGDQADPRLQDLLDRVLGRSYLVTDLDAALMLASGPLAGQHARFITRDGMTLDADGRVNAGKGASDEAAGFLRRRAELDTLRAQVAELSATLETERTALKGVDTEAAAMTAQLGSARQSLAQQQRTVLQEQNKLERLQADLARVQREHRGLDQESAQLADRLKKLEEDRAKLQEKAESLGRLQEEETKAAQSLEAEVKSIQLRADAAQEQMTSAKVDVSKLSEQVSGARRELSRLENSRDELTRQARDLTSHLERLESKLAEHAAAIEQCAQQIVTSKEQATTLAAQSTTLLEQLKAAEQSASTLAEQVHAARQHFNVLERDWHSLEVSRRELEVKRENMEERTQEELSVDLPREYPEYREMMAGGDVTRIDTSEAALNIDTLKEAVRKLGSVNLEAMEEEKNLEQQNDTLVKQVADIDAARQQLEDLITTLNQVSRERFGEIFTTIQQNFGGESGMFRKLFGGGKAEVRLMPLIKEVENADGTTSKVETTETDLLESGIEVIAKPPGKEPRSISQLSGGEKTLTAVALLMSIFRSKPSCFCVLDEVDAALDEGNVGRFNHVIREYTDRSHFIVITHNKRTMQSADRLYGVTMQERGVSTRVSVRFDEVGKNGEISAKASEGAAALNTHAIVESKANGSLKAGLAAMREDTPVMSN